MAAADLIENGDRPETRRGFEHWHNLALPDSGKRVGPAAAARLLLLRW